VILYLMPFDMLLNVHKTPSWATSRKEGIAWYSSSRPMPSVWLGLSLHWPTGARFCDCLRLSLQILQAGPHVMFTKLLSQFNIWTLWCMDITSAESKVNLSLLRSNSLKFQPQSYI
jgi:hypothetical protein